MIFVGGVMDTKKKLHNLRRIALILVGTLIMSLGTYFFNVPANIAAGGVTGLSQVLVSLMPFLNLGIVMGVFNLVILTVGIILLGKEFGVYTLIGAVSYSLYMTIFDFLIVLEKPILEDNIANLLIGAVLLGVGLAIVFRQNASTGGTDVIAKIIEKKASINLSTAILIVDTFVILFATSIYGLEKGIYAFMSLYVTTYCVDVTIAGFNSKIQMTIISNQAELINNFIFSEIKRGSTFYKASGGYTKQERNILVTIVDQKQYIKIRNFINSIDEDAFVYITNINEVIGYGFTREMIYADARKNAEISN